MMVCRSSIAKGGWTELFLVLLVLSLGARASAAQTAPPRNEALEEKIARVFSQLPPLRRECEGGTEAEADALALRREHHRQLLREKLDRQWFAALVATEPPEAEAIQARFKTWNGFMDFVAERQALVEVWTYGEGGWEHGRRVPATELAALRQQPREQPLFVTLSYRRPESGRVVKQRVEYGFEAAAMALQEQEAFQRQRDLQTTALRILGACDDQGRLSGTAQWEQLQAAVNEGRFPLAEMPAPPVDAGDFLVAAECAVDEANLLQRPLRMWRDREVKPKIVKSPAGYRQVLLLRKGREKTAREALAYRAPGVSDELEPVPAPVPGQDYGLTAK